MLKITKDSNPDLRKRSSEVPLPLSKENKELLLSMLKYIKDSQDEEFKKKHPNVREGIGLAAPQVGKNLRMLAIYYSVSETEAVEYALVNPKIISNSVKQCYLEAGEGCLSVDNPHEGYAYRSYRIQVKAYDLISDQDILIKATGFDAIVLQHEIDHLDGVLFYDHIDKIHPFKKLDGAVSI